MHFRRVAIVDIASLGIGAAKDAAQYHSARADTLGHLDAQYLLHVPTLQKLGLGNIHRTDSFLTVPPVKHPLGCYGKLRVRARSGTRNASLREMFDFNAPLRTLSIFDHLAREHYTTVIIARLISYLANQNVCTQIQEADNNIGFQKLIIQFERMDSGLVYLQVPELPTEASHKDPQGYAAILSIVDKQIDLLMSILTSTDLLMVTASFANDPTDQDCQITREYLPILMYASSLRGGKWLGVQNAGAVAATLLDNFKTPNTAMPAQCSLLRLL